jgi:hypothetical protein
MGDSTAPLVRIHPSEIVPEAETYSGQQYAAPSAPGIKRLRPVIPPFGGEITLLNIHNVIYDWTIYNFTIY